MIFVTVGTHEQQFNRLVEKIDELKGMGLITDDVIIQTGYSTYEPKHCAWQRMFPYQQMLQYVSEARIVLTHGGPSSFMMALQAGKTPIVVPRQKELGEHVNDHQVDFCKAVERRMGRIITIEDINVLGNVISNYDRIIAGMKQGMNSNNDEFNEKLEKIVMELMR